MGESLQPLHHFLHSFPSQQLKVTVTSSQGKSRKPRGSILNAFIVRKQIEKERRDEHPVK